MISFCITCKGRLWQLKDTLQANIDSSPSSEFVLVDYRSDDGLDEFISQKFQKEISSGVLRYYKLIDDLPWNAWIARNFSHRLATGDILCNLDADNYLDEMDKFIIENVNDSSFVRCKQGSAYGRIALTKNNFFKSGGYDETFDPMGYGDCDFCYRLEKLGLTQIISINNFCRSIPQSLACKVKYCNNKTFYDMWLKNSIKSELNICYYKYVANEQGFSHAKFIENFSKEIQL